MPPWDPTCPSTFSAALASELCMVSLYPWGRTGDTWAWRVSLYLLRVIMKKTLESRLLGEISITSGTQMTPSLWLKVKKN